MVFQPALSTPPHQLPLFYLLNLLVLLNDCLNMLSAGKLLQQHSTKTADIYYLFHESHLKCSFLKKKKKRNSTDKGLFTAAAMGGVGLFKASKIILRNGYEVVCLMPYLIMYLSIAGLSICWLLQCFTVIHACCINTPPHNHNRLLWCYCSL